LSELQALREEWEKGLTPFASHQPDPEWTLLVVLYVSETKRDAKQLYYCHRYFRLGDEWAVSVDRAAVSAEAAIRWALTCGRASPDRDPV
jgi:hypothetical protein